MKKYFVLGFLFLLPISIYMFFATGVNNFGKLPVLVENIQELQGFVDLEGNTVQLDNKITILGFFGNDPLQTRAFTYNLAHKIYKKNHEFSEFQFVILLPENTRNQAKLLTNKIGEIAPTTGWKFAFGSPESINNIFNSLESGYKLDLEMASPYVFIIDKERSLRGRNDDEDTEDGMVYGYNSANIGDINNRMSDDVKVVLAEYRRALKKNNKRRDEILQKGK
jgi:hypothetical protein